MHKTKNHYIKYTRVELENYCKHPETCIKKVNCIEPIRFSPTIFGDFQSAILKILSRKIGKYDMKLNGVVLDFRNTRILTSQSGIRQDSAFSVMNVETNFYVFSPRKGAIVTGSVKYINRMNMETIVCVVIYRVFNVKVTIRGKVKQELERNQEIKIRVKDFHFENVIPFIEGEIVDAGMLMKSSTKKLFDDAMDSGISESSISSDVHREMAGPSGFQKLKVKQERESSVESFVSIPPKVTKNRKRMKSESSDGSAEGISKDTFKKIKLEPIEPEDKKSNSDSSSSHKFRKSKADKSTNLSPTSSKKKPRSFDNDKSLEMPTTAVDKEQKSKKKKKKKDKHSNEKDDFETSLQLLLNSAQIKKEK